MGFKRKLFLLVGVFFGAVFLWLALRDIDFVLFFKTLRYDVNYWYALPFLACYMSFFWLKALRWKYMLHPVCNAKASKLFPAVMIGYAGNILVPVQLGELVRAYVTSHQLNIRVMPIVATIFLERILDLITLLTLLFGLLLFSGQDYSALATVLYFLGSIAAFGIFTIVSFVFFSTSVLKNFRRMTSIFSDHIQEKILLHIGRLVDGLQSIKQPRLLFGVVITSIGMWVLMILSTYMSLLAIENLDVPFTAGVVVLTVTIAGLALPTSPGFVGTIQYSFVLGLSAYGVAQQHALAASVLYHVLIIVPPLVLGIYYFVRTGYKTKQVQEEVTHYSE